MQLLHNTNANLMMLSSKKRQRSVSWSYRYPPGLCANYIAITSKFRLNHVIQNKLWHLQRWKRIMSTYSENLIISLTQVQLFKLHHIQDKVLKRSTNINIIWRDSSVHMLKQNKKHLLRNGDFVMRLVG
jgi:hypothetical protein